MPELLIIDGSSMLSTCYYGNLPKSILFAKTEEEKEKHYEQILHTSDGKYTNAMFTMLRTLLGIYKKVKPEYVAFVFDKTRDTFRRTELGADFYKANRKETAKPLKEQFIQMEEFLQEIGCAVFMSDDYEADDYAASLVEKFEGPDLQTYVLTKDHDYFQVVSEYTRMWRVVNKDKLEQLKEPYGLFGDDVHVDHHEHHAQQAGHIARCKHTSHRDLGGKREHDQAHARRDDGGDQRGSDGNGCAELFIVAALEHFRHKNLCFHGGVCGC